jgi:hydroxymethylglutaryl-CoA lyase
VTPEVRIVEVGPRDGFQMERAFIPTALKVSTVDAITAAGAAKLEVTSFVSPKVIPQMADAAEVMAAVVRRPGVTHVALVPNTQGARRAIAAGADVVKQVICVTETYNRRNVGLSVMQSMATLTDIVAAAGDRATVEVVVALAFGCPLEGVVTEDRVMSFVDELVASGIREISIADSVGVAHPRQVASMMRRLQHAYPDRTFSLHLHDTRGLGLVNVLAAMGEGIRIFDASIGGLGGCPVVPGASGNIATEDLVNLCEEMGVTTGIDLDRLIEATRPVQAFLGRQLPSRVLAAGTRARWFASRSGAGDGD